MASMEWNIIAFGERQVLLGERVPVRVPWPAAGHDGDILGISGFGKWAALSHRFAADRARRVHFSP